MPTAVYIDKNALEVSFSLVSFVEFIPVSLSI